MDRKKEQFSLIYDQYIEKIYRFVYLKVSSQEIAQDLTSKVFLKGWESYQKEGKNIQNQGAFLYQIARNVLVDYYRERDKKGTISTENISQMTDQKTNIHEKAVLNAEIDTIKLAIAKLKKDHQNVLIWYYLEDMPTEQIAVLMDKPVGTVRVLIHRGLEALKNELSQQA